MKLLVYSKWVRRWKTLLVFGACIGWSLSTWGISLASNPDAGTRAPINTQNLDQQIDVNPIAKNVIFLIGDGMGLAHVSGAIASSDESLALQRAQGIGLIRTSSASHFVTDSAAAGTALSSGQKTNNGVIGQDVEGAAIPSLLAYAAQEGKSTGIVVTSTVTHATPAAFYGHNKTRRDELSFAEDLLDANLDVAIGGGLKFFEKRPDKKKLTDEFRAKGYTVAYRIEEVLAAPQGSPLLGLLDNAALPRITQGRGPILAQATTKALELLGVNPKGFVLMVEGSQIDWGGHRNDWDAALTELLDFDSAIEVAMNYADMNPGTLVVVTADHETGGLSLMGRTVTPHWGTKNHTGIMVPIYAYGAGSEYFVGIYENTEVFDRMLKALGIAKEPAPPVRNAHFQTSEADLSSPGASIGQP